MAISSFWMRIAFNSLSRDHWRLEAVGNADSVIVLSTPSLGITRISRDGEVLIVPPFNSLSRDHILTVIPPTQAVLIFFQLPLSGSRRSGGTNMKSICLSTPSLGITRREKPLSISHLGRTLSTPSLGITCRPGSRLR